MINTSYIIQAKFSVSPKYAEAQDIEINYKVTFYDNIEKPILMVQIKDAALFVNNLNLILKNKYASLTLETPIVLSDA